MIKNERVDLVRNLVQRIGQFQPSVDDDNILLSARFFQEALDTKLKRFQYMNKTKKDVQAMVSSLCFRYNVSFMDEYAMRLERLSGALLDRGHEAMLLFLQSLSCATHSEDYVAIEENIDEVCINSVLNQTCAFSEVKAEEEHEVVTDESLSDHNETEINLSSKPERATDISWSVVLPCTNDFMKEIHVSESGPDVIQYWMEPGNTLTSEKDLVREVLFELTSPKYQRSLKNVSISHLSHSCISNVLCLFRDLRDKLFSLEKSPFVRNLVLNMINIKISSIMQNNNDYVNSFLQLEKELGFILSQIDNMLEIASHKSSVHILNTVYYINRKKEFISSEVDKTIEDEIFMHHIGLMVSELNYGIKTTQHESTAIPVFLSDFCLQQIESIRITSHKLLLSSGYDQFQRSLLFPGFEETNASFGDFVRDFNSTCEQITLTRQKHLFDRIISHFAIEMKLKNIWNIVLCRNGVVITEYVRELLPFVNNFEDFDSNSVFQRICDENNVDVKMKLFLAQRELNGWLQFDIEGVSETNVFLQDLLTQHNLAVYIDIFNLILNMKLAIAHLNHHSSPAPSCVRKMTIKKFLYGFESYIHCFVVEVLVKQFLLDIPSSASWDDLIHKHNKLVNDIKSLLFLGQRAVALSSAFKRLISCCIAGKMETSMEHDIEFIQMSLQKIGHFDYLLSLIA